MWYMTSRKRQSGQLLPIAAAAFLVMCALAGLAICASRDYLDKRHAPNAAGLPVLAAAEQMALCSQQWLSHHLQQQLRLDGRRWLHYELVRCDGSGLRRDGWLQHQGQRQP